MKKRPIIVHIGFPKTGTTSLQAGLGRSRDQLLANGFCYPVSLGDTNQYHLEAYAFNFDKGLGTHTIVGVHNSEDLKRFRKDCAQQLIDEVKALPDSVEKVIVSNEGLAGLTSEGDFDRFFELLNKVGHVEKVVAYIRRQDKNAASNYTTYLKTGGTRKNILQKYSPGSAAYIFYGDKLKIWADRIGIDKIAVRYFDKVEMKDGDIFSDFRDVTGLPKAVNFEVKERTNPSITPAACEFLRAFNERFPRFVDGKNNPARATVRETLEAKYAGPGRMPTQRDVADYMQQFAASNEYIRANWFPERPHLFDDNYSEYPEKDFQASTAEVTEIFNEVWAQRFEASS
jgi:hypothetical protein